MKKILSVIFLISVCVPGISQLIGNGTYANPWHGTMSGNSTWIGTKYISGDIIIDNETLIINPGAIIIFLSEGADLIISGTGRLIANGTSQNLIRFTSDDNNNGTFGESGERWGHIYINSIGSALSSQINECIIEYGYKNGTLSDGSGGGILINSNNISVSNSIIRYNYAATGGGISINKNLSPSITSCLITENISSSSGGGLYITTGSAALVTDCIITRNSSQGGGGGGGIFLGSSCGNVKFINCTIVNNSAGGFGLGKNIRLISNNNPTRPSFINCIIWIPANSINYSSQTPAPSDFINCAILNPVAGSTTNSITLSALNTAPTGPNFAATDGSDWSLEFVSPCRDAGTIPTPSVPLDYLGYSRIGQYDIGAYEFQYALWTGTTDSQWSLNTNWNFNVLPSPVAFVVIAPSINNPLTSTDVTVDKLFMQSGSVLNLGLNTTFIANNVDNRGTINVNPTSKATFVELINNGILNLNSSGLADIFSLIIDTYSGSGTTNAQLFITGGGGPYYNWHYVAEPFVDGLSTTYFLNVNARNLLSYNDSRVISSDFNGWEYHNGYAGTSGIAGGDGFTTLDFRKGYNFYNGTDATVALTGTTAIGTTLGTFSLQYSGSTPGSAIYGYNLLGNSLTCSLDWDLVTLNGSVNSAVYFTIGNKWATYLPPNLEVNGATKDIPPLQGFFVKANDGGASIDLSNAREHSSQPRYRKSGNQEMTSKSGTVYPKIKLELLGAETSDETIVWYNNDATTGFDEKFDATKMFSSETIFSQIYSIMEGQNYVINGMPLPTDSMIVPLGVKFANPGAYSLLKKDYVAPDGYDILLIDKANNNFTVNLKNSNEYQFSAEAGTFTDRFFLKILSLTTGIEVPETENKDFNIYGFQGIVNIIPMNSTIYSSKGEIRIFDLTGRVIKQIKNVKWYEGTPVQVPCRDEQGIYLVEITSGAKRFVGKVFLP